MKTISKLKKNLVLVLVCALLATIAVSPASSKLTASGTTDADGAAFSSSASHDTSALYYELQGETDSLQLWVDKTYGIFKVVNKENGYEWLSTRAADNFVSDSEQVKSAKSLLTIEYVNADDEIKSANIPTTLYSGAQHANINKTAFDFDSVENGFKITYVFDVDLSTKAGDDESSLEDIQNVEVIIKEIAVPVLFTIEDDILRASVDVKNIKCDKQLLLTKITLLPYFGAATKNDEGYLFVPDGTGALINFNGHATSNSSYKQRVYGDDLSLSTEFNNSKTEAVRMPVFGMKNGNNAFLAVITSGTTASSIEATPANLLAMYSHVNAFLETKMLSETIMAGKLGNNNSIFRLSEGYSNVDKFEVEYRFLSGDEADYVGMAKTYRNYLQGVGAIKNNVTKPVLNVDTYGAIDVKANFLGFNYSATESLTTYEETKKIIEALEKKGISQLGVRYIGWANNGVNNSGIVDDVDFIGDLGSKSDFNDLSDYLNKKSIPLVTEVDLVSYSNGSEKVASKSAFSETYYKYQYLRSVYSYDLNGTILMLLRPDYIKDYAFDFLDAYEEEVASKNLSVSSLTNTVYSSLKRDEQVFRTDTVGYYNEIFEKAKEKDITLYGESANDYSFKYISKIYKSPIYSSAYKIFDEEIPFYQIVLHGSVTMTGDAMVQALDKENVFLKCVESGSELLWNGIYEDSAQLADTNYDYLYGSTYSLWADDAASKYSAYYPLLNKIYDQEIVDHAEVADNVTMTEYANGIKVYVNYTDFEVKLSDGTVVPAMNFEYKEG